LLTLLGAHPIFHISRIRVKQSEDNLRIKFQNIPFYGKKLLYKE
jgi:hypothetical protein